MPGDLIGKPSSVVRDALGKIIYLEFSEGEEPEQIEHYSCDSCGKPFIVEPVIIYKVRKEAEELDFTEQSVSLL